MITIDFETFSELDVKKVGAYKYAEHASTEVLCLRWNYPEDPDFVYLWTPGEDREELEDLFACINNGEEVEAHNAGFEWVIWNGVCVSKYGFPELNVNNLYCSAAKAAAASMPRKLEDLAVALNSPIQKDMDGHRVMLKLSKPRKPSKNNPATRWTKDAVPGDFEKLYDYCGDDVLAEKAASQMLPDLSKTERRVWLLDQLINTRGIYCDIELCKIAVDFAKEFQDKLLKELDAITNGYVKTAKQVVKFKDWLNLQGVSLPNLQADTVEEALNDAEIKGDARRALEIRRHLAKSSITKFEAMLRMASEDDGRIRGTLLYHGAGTGRWTGRGIQPQNFIRGSVKDLETLFETLAMGDLDLFEMVYENPMDALASATRGMLRAEPGHKLVAGDYAAIEARVLFWLAGCSDGLSVFKRGEDIYKDMATDIYRIRMADVTKDQRQLGKQAILGLGYGMGKPKFKTTCLGYGMEVSDSLAALAVDTYREKYFQVPEYWRGMEKAAIKAVETKSVIKFKNLKWGVKGPWLFCQLPSGRKLGYFKPRVEKVASQWGAKPTLKYMSVNSVTRQWEKTKTYGGKLCIAEDTLVLTDEGWLKIQNVNQAHKLWDGVEWVPNSGLIFNGVKKVINCHGAFMTPDHLVLTEKGWLNASQGKRYNRASCRLPYGVEISRQRRQKIAVGCEMSLQKRNYFTGNRTFKNEKTGNSRILRLHEKSNNSREKNSAWSLATQLVRGLAFNETKMRKPKTSRLEKLRRPRHKGLSKLVKLFRQFFKRHGADLFARPFSRPQRQQRKLYAVELPLGDRQTASPKPPIKKRVYDLMNCGPLNRFTILAGGKPLIVHNCENVTQAVARDLMVNSMFELEKEGYKIVLSVHDEVVTEVKKDFGSPKHFEEIMERLPKWAEGFPVKAEAWEGLRFRK
jgi:DNA polymerase